MWITITTCVMVGLVRESVMAHTRTRSRLPAGHQTGRYHGRRSTVAQCVHSALALPRILFTVPAWPERGRK